MKRVSKKITAILLTIAITLLVFPANIIAFAENNAESVADREHINNENFRK